MNRDLLRAVCLTGPTACGKTDLALELANVLPIEIVSVDSAMVYRGMDIGTAKPSPAIRAAVPHHLIDVVDPAEPYSAGRFLKDATGAIEDVVERGKLPLLVGGTLLYLRALNQGLARLPKADVSIRRDLDQEAATEGWPAMHRRLKSVDPQAAARIAPTDRQRIQRALEVYMLTGQPISELQREAREAPRPDISIIALIPDSRERLGVVIASRFDAMVKAGFVSEVESLKAREDLNADTPSMRAVGYRQVWAYLAGRYDWETAREKAVVATRQLAKRQMTWLRSETDIERLEAFSQELPKRVLESVRSGFGRWA